MIVLLCFLLRLLPSPFKSTTGRLEAENAALQHQIARRAQVRGRVEFTNSDRLFFILLYRWFPSIRRSSTAAVEPAPHDTFGSSGSSNRDEDVRFTPIIRPLARGLSRPRCANSGREQVQHFVHKSLAYSITLSARDKRLEERRLCRASPTLQSNLFPKLLGMPFSSPQPVTRLFLPTQPNTKPSRTLLQSIPGRLLLTPTFAYVRKPYVPFVFLSNLGEGDDHHP
jgi:hypothetical protein